MSRLAPDPARARVRSLPTSRSLGNESELADAPFGEPVAPQVVRDEQFIQCAATDSRGDVRGILCFDFSSDNGYRASRSFDKVGDGRPRRFACVYQRE